MTTLQRPELQSWELTLLASAALVVAILIWSGLTSGRVRGPFSYVERDTTPLSFWTIQVLRAGFVILATIAVLWTLLA